MFNSIDSLTAFVHAAQLGSFSAAARHMGKSQSTVSEAISQLEIDAGVALFDRRTRQPTLTAAGARLLSHAQHVLHSHAALRQQALALQGGEEAQLSIVLSDTFQSQAFETLLTAFAERFPLLSLECLVGEDDDVLALLRSGRAQLGVMRAQGRYQADVSAQALPGQTAMALYVGAEHPLAQVAQVDEAQLLQHRELRLSTYTCSPAGPHSPSCWLAPSYLLLLELTARNFGWAALPTWLAAQFGHGQLVQLNTANWPQATTLDLVWLRTAQLGPAACWLIQQLQHAGHTAVAR